MLNTLTTAKKSFLACLSLSLFGFLFCSCGKKVTHSDDGTKDTRNPALSSSVEKIANDGSSPQAYSMKNIGKVFIPPTLEHVAGDRGVQTKLYFSYGESTEFFCLYGFKMSDEYSLINCYSDDVRNGGVMNLKAGDPVVLYDQEVIRMENSGVFVRAEVDIEWH